MSEKLPGDSRCLRAAGVAFGWVVLMDRWWTAAALGVPTLGRSVPYCYSLATRIILRLPSWRGNRRVSVGSLLRSVLGCLGCCVGLKTSLRGNPGNTRKASFGPLPAFDVGLYSYHCGRVQCNVMLRMQTLVNTPTHSVSHSTNGSRWECSELVRELLTRACKRWSSCDLAAPWKAQSKNCAVAQVLSRGSSCNLVDPASSHMLVSKIKPCMSKYKLLYGETANGSLKQLSSP